MVLSCVDEYAYKLWGPQTFKKKPNVIEVPWAMLMDTSIFQQEKEGVIVLLFTMVTGLLRKNFRLFYASK